MCEIGYGTDENRSKILQLSKTMCHLNCILSRLIDDSHIQTQAKHFLIFLHKIVTFKAVLHHVHFIIHGIFLGYIPFHPFFQFSCQQCLHLASSGYLVCIILISTYFNKNVARGEITNCCTMILQQCLLVAWFIILNAKNHKRTKINLSSFNFQKTINKLSSTQKPKTLWSFFWNIILVVNSGEKYRNNALKC